MIKKLSIIIPAYNEGRTIHLILDKVRQVILINGIQKEVIIVNDASKDNTKEAIENYIKLYGHQIQISLHNQQVNQGKGAAIHKGIDLATGEFSLQIIKTLFPRSCIHKAFLSWFISNPPQLTELHK